MGTFDVVALQEVMRPEALRGLLQLLPGWDMTVSERAVGRNGYLELYAVLYRKEAVALGRAFLAADPRDDFVREPFVACFDAHDFDFCLVTFHATFTGGARVRDEEIEALGLLLMDLRAAGGEKDWIVAGDFNRPDTAPGFETLTDAGWACTLSPSATPTTIGQEKYTNAYDHLLVDRRHTREWTRAERFDLVAKPCTDDFRWCREEVADHAPVVATFRTDGPDDD